MKAVIDTSIIMAVILNEPSRSNIISSTVGVSLLAPFSVYWEIGNALSALMKRKRINSVQAQEAFLEYQKIPIQFAEIDMLQSIDLSAQLQIYAYDAYLIACALKNNTQLMTLDQGLIHAAKQCGG